MSTRLPNQPESYVVTYKYNFEGGGRAKWDREVHHIPTVQSNVNLPVGSIDHKKNVSTLIIHYGVEYDDRASGDLPNELRVKAQEQYLSTAGNAIKFI